MMKNPETMEEIVRNWPNQSAEIAEYICQNHGGLKDLHCGEFPITHTWQTEWLVWSAFTSLITVALVGNACVMWIIVNTRAMHHSFNYFLFNMALADFLMALLNTGTSWTYNFYFDWWYGSFCHLNQFFGVAPTCISVFTMMLVSHDRCMAITNPLGKRAMSRRRALAFIAGIWLVASLISLPNVIGAGVEASYYFSKRDRILMKTYLCKTDYDYKFIYDDGLFVVEYAIPLFVLTYTFARIMYALRRDNFPSASRISQPRNHLKDKRKVVKMLALVVIIFMVCWLPYQLYHMFPSFFISDTAQNSSFESYLYLFFYWMAMSATMYNPIIYCVFNARFRVGFMYVFRWLPGVNFPLSAHQNFMHGSEFSRTIATSMKVHNKGSQESEPSPLIKNHQTMFFRTSSPTPSIPLSM